MGALIVAFVVGMIVADRVLGDHGQGRNQRLAVALVGALAWGYGRWGGSGDGSMAVEYLLAMRFQSGFMLGAALLAVKWAAVWALKRYSPARWKALQDKGPAVVDK